MDNHSRTFVSGPYKFTDTACSPEPLKAGTQIHVHDVFSIKGKSKAETHNDSTLFVIKMKIEGCDELVSSVLPKKALDRVFGSDLQTQVKKNTKSGVLTIAALVRNTYELVLEDNASSLALLQREGKHTFPLTSSGETQRGIEVRDWFSKLPEEERELLGGFHKTHVLLKSSTLKLGKGCSLRLLPDILCRVGVVDSGLDEFRRNRLLNVEALEWEHTITLAIESGMTPEDVIRRMF